MTRGRLNIHLGWLSERDYVLSASPQQPGALNKKKDYILVCWNILIELASDLLSETPDRGAEVLHYLSCKSFNESFSFIPALLSPAGGIHLLKAISTWLSHERREGVHNECVENNSTEKNLGSLVKMLLYVRGRALRSFNFLVFLSCYNRAQGGCTWMRLTSEWQAGCEAKDF